MNRYLICITLLAGLLTVSPAWALTIAEIAGLPESTSVTIDSAVVLSTTDLVADPGYRSFQVRDNTRAMTIYGTNVEIANVLAGLQAGAEVEGISGGVTARLNGALGLVTGTPGGFAINGISQYGSPNPIPGWPIFSQDLGLLDSYESDLVCIKNVMFDSEGYFVVGQEHSIAGGLGSIYIATSDLDLAGKAIPAGPLDITGIVIPNTAGNGYCVAPRSLSDIVPVPEPASLALLSLGVWVVMRRRR